MRRCLPILITAVFLAGCGPRQSQPALTDGDLISTLVSATQTAAGFIQGPDPLPDTLTPLPEPGDPTLPPPTETLTPTPTETLTPSPSPSPTLYSGDPLLSLGAPSFKDNFESGENFYLYDNNQVSFQVDDDRMILIAKKANNYEAWTLSWEEIKNFYLEISGVFGEECAGKDRYGLIFRAPDVNEGYLLTITCDGSYRLSTWESDVEEYTIIRQWTSSVRINTGPGAVNRLGIKTKDSKLTGYINGFEVFVLNDGTFPKGRFGVLVAATETPGFTAYLTQAAYWKLP